jgi:WD40 repeat protein
MVELTRRKLAFILVSLVLAVGGVAFSHQAADRPDSPPKSRVEAEGARLPGGALTRMGTGRLRHGQPVDTLACSPSGKTIASAGADGVIRLWDIATGEELRTFAGHTGPVRAVAFAPDGKTIASGGNNSTVRLWEVATGREVEQFRRKPGRVAAVAFSPDGKTVAAGCSDRSITLLDARTATPRRLIDDQKGAVRAVVFFPDGKKLASAGEAGWIHVHDTKTGELILSSSRREQEAILGLALSPDGKVLASCGPLNEHLVLWEAASGKVLQRLHDLAYRPVSVAFSPDGKQLIVGGTNGTLRRWDTTSWKELKRLEEKHAGWVGAVAFTPDSRKVASAGGVRVALRDIATGSEVVSVPGHHEPIWSASLSPDGRLAATSDLRTVCIWDTATGKELRQCKDHPGYGVTPRAACA